MSDRTRGIAHLFLASLLLVGCGLLGEDHTEQTDAPRRQETTSSSDTASGRSAEDRPEEILVEHRFDSSTVRVRDEVGGVRIEVPRLTPVINKFGTVSVFFDAGPEGRFLPWTLRGAVTTLGALEITFAYEKREVYILYLGEQDLLRSALPTGEARIILRPPRDTSGYVTSPHRTAFFEKELKKIGFWASQ